ncbi:D-2-hydroxyacid dehydrogenase family protein [Streptomyces syringium]|uniref:D-2-hydroxyacid dehydrogenase family protein n=1 Tax=Streptomyces syringium TaxID=76729 RepID=UPI00344737F7
MIFGPTRGADVGSFEQGIFVMRIAVIDDYNSAAAALPCWEGLPDGADVRFFSDHLVGPDAVAERLADFDAVVAMRERTAFTAEVLARLPRLKLLVTAGMHNAAIDLGAAARHGVVVSGTRMTPFPAAELTWALILELSRRAGAQDAGLRSGSWQSGVGTGLAGGTLGVVGLGKLGTRVAAVGAAFGMDVVAWSPHMTDERAKAVGVRAVGKEELFSSSDVVSVHLRLSEATTGLVAEDDLRRMRRTAFLVNTSRAQIVDEDALIKALGEGWIAGAGLDVYEEEPLPAGHRLLDAPNTVLTPHIGYVTGDNFALVYGDSVEAVNAYLGGSPVRVLTGE